MKLVRTADEATSPGDEIIKDITKQVFLLANGCAQHAGVSFTTSGFLSGFMNFVALKYEAEDIKKMLAAMLEHVDDVVADMRALEAQAMAEAAVKRGELPN